MLSDSALLSLPTELRHSIYKLIIQNVAITLRRDVVPSIETRSGTRIHKPISSREMLKYVGKADRHKIVLLYTSKFCFEDAIAIWADNTTIFLNRNDSKGEDRKILAVVDAAFLRRVPELSMSPQCGFRFKHTIMPRLQQFRMTGYSKKAYNLDEAIHELFCHRCNGPPGQARYQKYWRSISGGFRRKDQLRQLARNQGWDLKFTLSYGSIDPPTRDAEVKMELKYDLSNDELISKRLKWNGRTVASGSAIRDVEFED